MIGKVALAGGPKCPICGKEFKPEPPLIPNTEDREFYGGRVKFFKEVTCDCTARYKLCIEKRFNSINTEDELKVINMIVLKPGTSVEDAKRQEEERLAQEAEQKTLEAVHKAFEEKGAIPTLKERDEIKKQVVLATIADPEEKINTLMQMTTHELQVMCKRRKLKYRVRDSKREIAELLLAYDPSLVVANPKG